MCSSDLAFGTIELVDIENQIATLHLVDGELRGIHLQDFCRGIFHNLEGNPTTSGKDSSGFDTMAGFSTSYFTPTELLDDGKSFKYDLKPGTTVHPCESMKFAVYGNPVDTSRQASAYDTRTYKRYLKGVDTWEITTDNIAMQFGDCSGLTINGVDMSGYSAYLNNVYITGVIKWLEDNIDKFKGKDAYIVELSSYYAIVNVNNQGQIDDSIYDLVNIVSGENYVYTGTSQIVQVKYKIQTKVQVSTQSSTLEYVESNPGEGEYSLSVVATGCTWEKYGDYLTIKSISEDFATLEITVNLEGKASILKTFQVKRVYDGQSIYVLNLTNDSATLPADNNGNVTDFSSSASEVQLYLGMSLVTDAVFSIKSATTGITAVLDGNQLSITAMTAPIKTGIVEIEAKVSGVSVGTIVYSVSKAFAGADGQEAVIYSLSTSATVIKKDKSGNLDVTTLTCTGYKTVGNALPVVDSTLVLKYKRSDDSSWQTYSSGIPILSTTTAIEIKLYASDGTTQLDSERIPVVIDGTDGKDGIDGTNGLNGADGVNGSDGTSIVWKGEYSSHPSNPQNGWAYKNTTDKKSYVYQSGVWYQMTIDGTDGTNGTNGMSIVWKGELSSPPSSPATNWAYRDTDNGRVYIYNGIAWALMVLDGSDGTDGTNGSNGLSVYITYNDSASEPSNPTGGGTSDGWHTNSTSVVRWMSQKVSDSATSGAWGNPILIRGTDGEDGAQGIPGCILRQSEWATGVEYRNDEALTSGTRYLDIAIVTTGANSFNAYKCKVTHTSSASIPVTNTTYWQEFSTLTPIYTPLILAQNSKIKFMQGNQLLIMKSDGITIAAGLVGGDYPLWIGGATPEDAPFKVSITGKMIGTDVELTGKITATDGKIAGLKISGNSLTNEGFDNDAYIIIRNDTRGSFAGIGGNTLPASSGVRAVARFQNEDISDFFGIGINYAMVLSAKGGSDNIALDIWGGTINGFATTPKIISSSQTLLRGAASYACLNAGGTDITLTMPTADVCDNGMIITIKRVGDGKVYLRAGSSKHREYSGSFYTDTSYGSYMNYDGGYYQYGSTSHQLRTNEVLTYQFFRDLEYTVSGTTYKGCWMQINRTSY